MKGASLAGRLPTKSTDLAARGRQAAQACIVWGNTMIRRRSGLVLVAVIAAALQACGSQSLPPPVASDTLLPPATMTSLPTVPVAPTAPVEIVATATMPSSACTPTELEAYVALAAPLLDQLAVADREATQLQALTTEQVAALAVTAAAIGEQLSALLPPDCLHAAHAAALDGARLLSQALDGIAVGAYANAESDLRSSFEAVSSAAALIGMQYWELTPVP